MFDVNWHDLFGIRTSLLELIVRGTAMYWALFFLFRFVIRRDVGAVGIADVLLIVLIADAAQNGMAGDYDSVTEGIVLVATLAGWNVLLDMLSYWSPTFAKLTQPGPLGLVENGRMLRRNMRQEWITEAELMTKLREQGVKDLQEVERACMESDGSVSVIKRSGDDSQTGNGPQRGAGTPV